MDKKLWLLLVLLLAGCTPARPSVPTETATPTGAPTLTPAPTSTPTLEPTATPEAIKMQHLTLLDSLPADLDFREGIVFPSFMKPAYISDLRKGILRTLVANDTIYVSTSPDGKWLAYALLSASDQRQLSFLVIESADGKQQKKLSWDKKWHGSIPIWLDNEHIMLNVVFKPGHVPPEIPSTVVINPFTGESRYIVSNYPDITPVEGPPPRFAFANSTEIYNPELTRVLYVKKRAIGEDLRSVVLWDMQTASAIVTLPGFVLRESAFWSPTEAKFLLPLSKFSGVGKDSVWMGEWFSLDKDGNIQQLTHFADTYTWARIFSDPSSLSPDGEALAFWLATSLREQGDLMVLNLKTREVTKYCFNVPALRPWYRLAWSLDSHFLMMTADNPEKKDNDNAAAYLSYLINLQQNWIVQINKSDDIPIGFVIEP